MTQVLAMNPYQLMYQTVFFENQQGPSKEDLLQKLKPYFYKGITEVAKPQIPVSIRELPQEQPEQTSKTLSFIPKPPTLPQLPPLKPIQNTLFWCLYHAKNGPPLYAETYDINMELRERHRIADYFRENTKCLKDRRHRLTNADVDELVCNLLSLSARRTFWTTCFGDIPADLSQAVVFAQYYKKNIDICIPERRIRVSFLYEEQADKITLLYNPTNNLFEITENAETLTTGYLSMETMKTSLKPLSQYKIGDLVEIGQQVGLLSPPKKKEELYKRIIEHCHGLAVSSSV